MDTKIHDIEVLREPAKFPKMIYVITIAILSRIEQTSNKSQCHHYLFYCEERSFADVIQSNIMRKATSKFKNMKVQKQVRYICKTRM